MTHSESGGRTSADRLVAFSVWLTFFNTWVLVEETIIDRHGLWAYLPYYRFGRLCAWDIGAAALIGWGIVRVFRARRRPPTAVS